jgi:hypothetical protein
MYITCGRCTKDANEVTKHSSVDYVRACYAAATSFYQDMIDDEGRAEYEAEMAAERYYENRGADDGFEQWEISRGVESFTDAWDREAPGTRPGYVAA